MKTILAGIIIGIIIAGGALVLSDRTTKAQDGSMFGPEISKKLDQIVAKQKDIMDGINAIKQELNVVKIRVTQQQ